MAYYYPEPSHTFSEYLLVPGYTDQISPAAYCTSKSFPGQSQKMAIPLHELLGFPVIFNNKFLMHQFCHYFSSARANCLTAGPLIYRHMVP